jgi:putative ABC transport system permease protein
MLIWCQFPEFIDIKGWNSKRKIYNESEANSGANVIVLGSEIASSF